MATIRRPVFWVPRPYDEPSQNAWPIKYNLALLGPGQFKPNITVHFFTHYYDPPQWQWEAPYNLALVGPQAFRPPITNKFYKYQDDAAFWQWKAPYNLAAFGIFQPPIYTHFFTHYDDPPVWQWEALYNLSTLGIPAVVLPFVNYAWHFQYDDTAVWAWPWRSAAGPYYPPTPAPPPAPVSVPHGLALKLAGPGHVVIFGGKVTGDFGPKQSGVT